MIKLNKNRKTVVIAAGIVTVSVFILLNFFSGPSETSYQIPESSNNSSVKSPADAKYGTSDIQFPRDYGTHNKFRNEWWYFSGNITDKKGRKFGYEFTLFRNAFAWAPTTVNYDKDQKFMAHFALTDISKNKFYYKEKFSLGSEGLAGATSDPLKFWLGDWTVRGNFKNDDITKPDFHIKAATDKYSVDLKLTSLKPVVLQGDNGISRKGPGSENFSHYYSLTRLVTSGRVIINGEAFEVEGSSWFDREWSNSTLGRNEDGWDWFCVQLNNNTEIMFYRFHGESKSTNKYDQGAIILENGRSEKLRGDDVKIEPAGNWESPIRHVYPSGWRFSIPSKNINLTITPNVKDQELELLITYWEGSCAVTGTFNGREVHGSGYVELTGY